jgi:alpha-D-ribose 1-methylphosphonate 5-triphosphate synthase subunit PhnG
MMDEFDRNHRFAVMAQAQGDLESLLTLAERVLDESGDTVTVVTPPRVGMVMLRLREPVDGTVYNAGEVLVTEARVALDQHEGYAMRLGRAPELTLAAAVLDAAVEARHALTSDILAQLAVLDTAEQARQLAAWREVAPTRVVFDEML